MTSASCWLFGPKPIRTKKDTWTKIETNFTRRYGPVEGPKAEGTYEGATVVDNVPLSRGQIHDIHDFPNPATTSGLSDPKVCKLLDSRLCLTERLRATPPEDRTHSLKDFEPLPLSRVPDHLLLAAMMDPTLLHSNDAKVIKKSYRHGNKLDDLGAQVLTKYKKARDHGLEFFSELHRTEALLQEWREESERLEQESTPTSTKDTEVSDKPLQKDAEVQGQPSRDRKRTGNEDKRATKGSEGTS